MIIIIDNDVMQIINSNGELYRKSIYGKDQYEGEQIFFLPDNKEGEMLIASGDSQEIIMKFERIINTIKECENPNIVIDIS